MFGSERSFPDPVDEYPSEDGLWRSTGFVPYRDVVKTLVKCMKELMYRLPDSDTCVVRAREEIRLLPQNLGGDS